MSAVGAGAAGGGKHIIVCGGGVIGACTAYYLSQHQHRPPSLVTIVERSSPACAASGKSGGFLAYDWCDGGPLSFLARASFNLHSSLAESLSGEHLYGYRRVHTLSVSVNDGKARSELPDWVDGAGVGAARKIGSPETTAQVHPRLFTRALIAEAEKRGNVRVVIGEVERVVVEEGKAVGVKLKGKEDVLKGDAVVVALGPWSSRMEVVGELFRVSGLKAHSVVIVPREKEKITPHALFLRYRVAGEGGKMLDPEVYPRPSGEVYVCGITKEEDAPDDPETIAGEPEAIGMLHEIAGAVSSHLQQGEGGAEVIAEQACYLPCSEDDRPVIGELPGAKGCYVATGHSCWGILNGPATGAAIAELILDGEASIVDLTPFSPSRFLRRRSILKR